MFQVISETKTKAPTQCADIVQAARSLLSERGLRVVNAAGDSLIETEWRYIDGDCYVQCGYLGNTPEGRLALSCAYALEKINREIQSQAEEAKKNLLGLTFEAISSKGKVSVRLAWERWMGFSMEIHEAETGYIVYSRWLDSAIGYSGGEYTEPTLEHYVKKAADLGVVIPENFVEIIRLRSLLVA